MKSFLLILLFLTSCFSQHYLDSEEISQILRTINNKPDSAKIRLYNKVSGFYLINEPVKGMKYAQKAESLALKTENKQGLVNAYLNIGSSSFFSSDYSAAMKNYKKSLVYAEEINDSKLIGKALNNIGSIYYKQKKISKAIEYFEKALPYKLVSNDHNSLINAYNNIAILYYELEKPDYEKILQNFKLAKTQLKEDNPYFESFINTNMASAYIEIGEYDIAEELLNKTREMLNGKSYLRREVDLWLSYQKLYDTKNNIKKAYEALQNYTHLNDSLNSLDSSEKLKKLQVQFEVQKKEEQIELLEKLQKLKDNQLAEEKEKNKFYLLLLLSIIIIVVFIVYSATVKHRANKLLADKNNLLKDNNERLEELNSTKDKFFSIIAHDLKNPFTSIYTISEYLVKFFDKLDNDKKRNNMLMLHESTIRILKLIENLLDWSRAESGSINFNQEKTDLKTMIVESTELLLPTANLKSIKVDTEIPENYPVFADKNMIKTVIRNLLSNAIKFTPENGEIKIFKAKEFLQVEVPSNHLIIAVQDNGKGIPEDKISHLFKIDNKYSTQGTNNEKGTGLGLLICKEFLDLHQGKIGVISKINEGSTFYFTLPNYPA